MISSIAPNIAFNRAGCGRGGDVGLWVGMFGMEAGGGLGGNANALLREGLLFPASGAWLASGMLIALV